LHVLTGGQRIEQFVRLKWADVSDDALTIFDGKGRPGQGPRAHQIPLVKLARADLALLKREGEFAISTTAGKKAISVRTLAGWAHDVVGDTIEGFQLKRIRSGVETPSRQRSVRSARPPSITWLDRRWAFGTTTATIWPRSASALETLGRTALKPVACRVSILAAQWWTGCIRKTLQLVQVVRRRSPACHRCNRFSARRHVSYVVGDVCDS
jgi:hypothetical protein